MRYEVLFMENDRYRSCEEFDTLDDALDYIETETEKDGYLEIIGDTLNVYHHYPKVYQDDYDEWHEDDISYLIRRI